MGLTVGLFFKVRGFTTPGEYRGVKHHEVMGCHWIIQEGVLQGVVRGREGLGLRVYGLGFRVGEPNTEVRLYLSVLVRTCADQVDPP